MAEPTSVATWLSVCCCRLDSELDKDEIELARSWSEPSTLAWLDDEVGDNAAWPSAENTSLNFEVNAVPSPTEPSRALI